jgi:hypothetical protein
MIRQTLAAYEAVYRQGLSQKADSVDHRFPAEAAPTPVLSPSTSLRINSAEGPPFCGHRSPLCFKIVIYSEISSFSK